MPQCGKGARSEAVEPEGLELSPGDQCLDGEKLLGGALKLIRSNAALEVDDLVKLENWRLLTPPSIMSPDPGDVEKIVFFFRR
jgi:hypothetical protein